MTTQSNTPKKQSLPESKIKATSTSKRKPRQTVKPVRVADNCDYFTQTRDYQEAVKSFTNAKTRFADCLYLIGLNRRKFESKPVVTGLTVQNYATQSVANRGNRFPVKVTAKIGNKTISVHNPIGFRPARAFYSESEFGYNPNDACSYDRGESDKFWSRVYSRSFDFRLDLEKEIVSMIGYFACQLITGELQSSESTFKADLLNTILTFINPSSIEVTYFPNVIDNTVVWSMNLTDIKNLVLAARFRTASVYNLIDKESLDQKSKTSGGKKILFTL